jgi:hypothetical protein
MTAPLLVLLTCCVFTLLWGVFPDDDDDNSDFPYGYR